MSLKRRWTDQIQQPKLNRRSLYCLSGRTPNFLAKVKDENSLDMDQAKRRTTIISFGYAELSLDKRCKIYSSRSRYNILLKGAIVSPSWRLNWKSWAPSRVKFHPTQWDTRYATSPRRVCRTSLHDGPSEDDMVWGDVVDSIHLSLGLRCDFAHHSSPAAQGAPCRWSCSWNGGYGNMNIYNINSVLLEPSINIF
jgi:hypothetical protein